MAKPFQDWKVLPHGRLTQIDDSILTVVGEIRMPLMELPRRMTVVRLRGARLAVYSAIALDEPEMKNCCVSRASPARRRRYPRSWRR